MYVAGYVWGNFQGQQFGSSDYSAYVRKYKTDGELLWQRRFQAVESTAGISATFATGLAVGPAGNVVVTGYTIGGSQLPGQEKPDGLASAFVRKYTRDGKIGWTRQFTVDSTATKARDLAIDHHGNVYVGGDYQSGTSLLPSTPKNTPGFFMKFTAGGRAKWTQKIRDPKTGERRGTIVRSVEADSRDRIVIASATSEGSRVARYLPDGTCIWERFSKMDVFGVGIVFDMIFLAGARDGAHVRAISSRGNVLWSRTVPGVPAALAASHDGAHGLITAGPFFTARFKR